MSKRRKHAKALVLQPLFRSRQEKARKGKGSYNRKARFDTDSGPCHFWGLLFS